MKIAKTLLLLGGMAQLVGCVVVADGGGSDSCAGNRCDDPGTDPSFGSFDVVWSAQECPVGSAAEVVSQNQVTSERLIDIFDCASGSGVTAALPVAAYNVWLEVTSADGSQLLAQSNAVSSTLSTNGEVANIDIAAFPINAGFFGLTWNLVDSVGTQLSCEEVFSDGVDIIATLAGTSEATVDIFNCTDFSGVTNEVPLGTHTIVVDVLDGETALGSSLAREETIAFGNELVDLGNFEFTF